MCYNTWNSTWQAKDLTNDLGTSAQLDLRTYSRIVKNFI